ncbi:MAG: DotA/TraY family protein, partial [Thiobacillus sp.]
FIKENGSLVGHAQPTSNISGDMSGILAGPTSLIVAGAAGFGTNSGDPLIAIRNIGNGMEDAGGAVYVAEAGLLGAVGAANGGPDKIIPFVGNGTNAAAKVVEYEVTPIALFIGGLLFVEGFFLSFVVPMIPFMVWIVALLGFLFMAFEMIVAAPLWGIMHMHPEGHEVVGMGAQGYKMALAIITRPFLMILGLIGGYALFMGFTALVTPMIATAITSGQETNGGFLGPLDLIGAVGVYVTLMVIIAYECFKLVFLLPEKMMAWASASHGGYDEGGTLNKQQGVHSGAKGQASKGAEVGHSGRANAGGASGGWWKARK